MSFADTTSGPYVQPRPGDGPRAPLRPTGRPETVALDCALALPTEPALASFTATALLLGAVLLVLGRRLGRGTLFLAGLSFGGALVYLVCQKESLLPPLGNAGVAAGAGLLCGLITGAVEYVGLFVTGFLWGLALGTQLLMVVGGTVGLASLWTTLGVLFLTGVAGALLSLKWERVCLEFGTALLGSSLLCLGLDALLLRLRLLHWIWALLNLSAPSASFCWAGWAVLGAWPTLAILGAAFQRLTGTEPRAAKPPPLRVAVKKRTPSVDSGGGGGRQSEELRRLAAPREDTVQRQQIHHQHSRSSQASAKSFRQLYQQRRSYGDVICQSFASRDDSEAPTTRLTPPV